MNTFWEIRNLWVLENYPAVNICCELWPFGTYDPDTCVLNSHLPVNNLPKEIFQKRCKVLWMQRNPKDRVVSLYKMKQHVQPEQKEVDWKTEFHIDISGQGERTGSLHVQKSIKLSKTCIRMTAFFFYNSWNISYIICCCVYVSGIYPFVWLSYNVLFMDRSTFFCIDSEIKWHGWREALLKNLHVTRVILFPIQFKKGTSNHIFMLKQ